MAQPACLISTSNFTLAESHLKLMVKGDFNHDGNLDLVIQSPAGISFLKGDGTGALERSATYQGAGDFSGMKTGDFNGDTHIDIILLDNYYHRILIMYGDGKGAFYENRSTPYQGIFGNDLTSGDFNGDSLTDVAFIATKANGKNEILIFNSKDQDKFHPPVSIDISGFSVSLQSADFNEDHKDEILVGSSDSKRILIYSLGASNQFSLENAIPISSHSYFGIITADYNSDGKTDLYLHGIGENNIFQPYIFLGNGKGSFTEFVTHEERVFGSETELCDFDKNGKLDVASIISRNGGIDNFRVNIYLSDSFTASQTLPLSNTLAEMVAGDFNNDSFPDIAAGEEHAGTVRIFLNKGNGSFTSDLSTTFNPLYLTSGDFNKDGIPDLVSSTNAYDSENSTTVYMGKKSGTEIAYTEQFLNLRNSAVADFDADGIDDVAGMAVNSQLAVYKGNLSGKFSLLSSRTCQDNIVLTKTGDLNMDGYPDLAALLYPSDKISVYLNDKKGNLIFYREMETWRASDFIITDCNLDEKNDLLVANENAYYGNVCVHLGNGDGSFQPYVNTGSNLYAMAIATGHFDSDTYPDVALAGGQNSVIILSGNGLGFFNAVKEIPILKRTSNVNSSLSAIRSGNINRDNYADLIVTVSDSSSFVVLYGKGNGDFSDPEYYNAGLFANSVVSADFNMDGLADLALGNLGGKSVTFVYNYSFPQRGQEKLKKCGDQEITLYAPGGFKKYRWNNAASDIPSITVKDTGQYKVTMLHYNGCETTKEYHVASIPIPAFSFGPDTLVCESESITLSPAVNNAELIWNDNTDEKSKVINKQGRYWLTATTSNLCSFTDTVQVFFGKAPVAYLPSDTTVCSKNLPFYFTLDSQNAQVLWQDGSMEPSYKINSPGVYEVTLSNSCGTTRAISDVTVKECDLIMAEDTVLFIPNVFTPNNDNNNDSFYIRHLINNPSSLTITNRWGLSLFTTENYQNDWKGEGVADGVYFYLLTRHKDKKEYRGWIQIIR